MWEQSEWGVTCDYGQYYLLRFQTWDLGTSGDPRQALGTLRTETGTRVCGVILQDLGTMTSLPVHLLHCEDAGSLEALC